MYHDILDVLRVVDPGTIEFDYCLKVLSDYEEYFNRKKESCTKVDLLCQDCGDWEAVRSNLDCAIGICAKCSKKNVPLFWGKME